MDIYLGGKRHRVDTQNPLGQGGEAYVFDLGDSRVVKVFRDPSDPQRPQSQS